MGISTTGTNNAGQGIPSLDATQRVTAGKGQGREGDGAFLVDCGVDWKSGVRLLPAPSRPRRFPTVRRATRADNIRKWLAFGPSPLADLAREMRCTRYALRHTLLTMPDVYVGRRVVCLMRRVAA